MRVRLCDRCSYVPTDIEGLYDPEAEIHLCAGCDSGLVASTNHYPLAKRASRKLLRQKHFRQDHALYDRHLL